MNLRFINSIRRPRVNNSVLTQVFCYDFEIRFCSLRSQKEFATLTIYFDKKRFKGHFKAYRNVLFFSCMFYQPTSSSLNIEHL